MTGRRFEPTGGPTSSTSWLQFIGGAPAAPLPRFFATTPRSTSLVPPRSVNSGECSTRGSQQRAQSLGLR